jgi:hypothetical protein
MKKWISLSVLGVFVSFISIVVITISQLTKLIQSDIFDVEETDEELF